MQPPRVSANTHEAIKLQKFCPSNVLHYKVSASIAIMPVHAWEVCKSEYLANVSHFIIYNIKVPMFALAEYFAKSILCRSKASTVCCKSFIIIHYQIIFCLLSKPQDLSTVNITVVAMSYYYSKQVGEHQLGKRHKMIEKYIITIGILRIQNTHVARTYYVKPISMASLLRVPQLSMANKQ